MVSGLFSKAMAKRAKDKLRRSDAFRNDQDARPKNPRPYPNAETRKGAMGENLHYKAIDSR